MNVQLVNIKPTEDHLDFSKRLLEFAQSGDGQLIFREELSPSEKMAKMLIVTGLGKKASLSPKLVNPEYHEGDNTKIGEAAKKIGEYYHLFNEQKGTQFVFCDLSTPKKGEWNAYQELKVRLVSQYGIPDEEIQFIQDASTEKKRKEFIAKMNTGEIRVLFGSTTTLGTGVNAQERAVAIHHLDLPWRPSDMEQRNGRAVRKGNLVARQYNDNKVDVFVYAVERSLDPYNFYLLSSKQDFIRQMKTGALGKRSFDQGGEDEASGMPFAEYVAITSGNTDLLERAKLEKRILGLESERKAFNAQQRSVAFQLDYARKDLEHDRNILAVLRQDMEVFENAAVKDEQGKFVNTLDVGPGIVTDEDKGRYLQDNARCLITEEVQVGSIYGFPVVMRPQSPEERANKSFNYQGNIFSVKGAYSYRINAGRVNLASRVAAASFPFESITRLPSLVSEYENYVARLEKEIPDLERLSEKVWDKSEQLSEMKQQLQALDRKIQQTLDSSIIQNQGGKGVESLPFTIVQHNWGREPWELKFKVSDYPYLNNEDRDAVEDAFHGSLRVYHGEVRGNFRHRFGAESAMMELTKLNQSHRDDVSWLTAAVQDVYDESSSYAYSRLKEMGLDRYGKPLQEEAYHLDAIALGNYMDVRALAHGAKERIDIPFEVAAKALARVVKAMPEAKHGVLVPMPGHTRDRDAMVLLTRMVAEQTGLDCVQNYLISAPHQSLYDWKKQHPNEELPDLFFVEKNKEVLKGRTPIIIDNVLDTGHTAWAALEAMSVQPVLVVLGATGNHERYGRDISLTIDQNSLDYIHNITPPGVGFTGKEQFEIDELFRKTRSEAWSARHSATEDLQDMGLDRNTGLYTFEVYDALQRWDSIYASGQASDVVNKVLLSGGYDQLFSEEERQHLTDADRTRMESLLKEYKGYSSDHVLEREYLYRPLVVNYEHLRGKAQLSMENVIQDAEVIEEANVQQETPSLGYDYETKSFNGIPADLKVYCNGEPDRIREVYGYTPNDDIDLVHFSAQGGREYDRTFARVWVEDKQAESPAKIVIQLEKEGYDVGLHGERGRYVDFGTWDEAVAFEQHVREIEQQLHAPKDVQETQVSPAQQSYGPVESPLMKQFYDLKAKHPDALLLFRSGDFYEAYEKDAKTASDLLGLTLTWRKELDGSEQHDYNTYHGAQVMFPHHALDTYLPKLVRAGLRIAICDQLEAPKRTVKRGTTELVDSGSGIRMQVVARQSSLSESEKKMISTIVSDLETGNHLLGRPRPEGYRQFFAEHYEAVRALQAGNKLTERQRDILLERVGNYYDGLSGLAASLEVNEQQLRKALYVDSISEQRTHPNLHLFEDGLYWYVESRTGYGVSQRYAEQVASLHSGEKTDYDGRTMMRFISKDDAVSFIGSISTLNDHYAKTLRDGLIERMRRACISVITNWEEGERVLALENGKPRMMAVDRNSEEYKKKVSDATQRIEIRLAELNRSINEENNLQSASRIPAKEPTPPLESGNKEAISSLAKVQRKIIKSNDLLEKMFSFIDNFPLTSQINAENYARNLISALDLPLQNQNSEYAFLRSDRNSTYTLRISNHEGSARNIIIKGVRTDKGFSIVLHTALSPESKFKANSWADVNEYVYENPSKERLIEISKSIFGLLDSGEYIDIANADEHNFSPRENMFEQRVVDTPTELSVVISGDITRQDVERAMDSGLVKQWLKAKNSNDVAVQQGFNIFGAGTKLIHEFAKARLGIDNKFEPDTLFYNSWEAVEDYLKLAAESGLSASIVNKYDFHTDSEDVQLIFEHPETMYNVQELSEIERCLKPAAFEDFKLAVQSFTEAKLIKAEEERIKEYNGGEAVTKAFVLYDIAQRRLFAEHEGDERWFRKQRTWTRPDGSHGILTGNDKVREGEVESFKYVLKSETAIELMHLIATSPVAEKVPLLDMMPSALERYLELPDQEERVATLRLLSDDDLDTLYLKAFDSKLLKGRLHTMRDIINVMAERRGYTLDSSYQGSMAFNGAAPSDGYYASEEERIEAWENEEFEGNQTLGDFINHGIDISDLDFRLNHPNGSINLDDARLEVIQNIKQAIHSGKGTIMMYRAVPDSVQEGTFRNGDWITPSRLYAVEHARINGWKENYRIIEQEVSVNHIWWDGNDIAEWGFDNGLHLRYKNTPNNAKLNDFYTTDDNQNVILPSQRFDDRKSDIRYMLVPDSQSPVFLSNALIALDKIKQDKATPEQWLNMLEKLGGIKSGEDRWTGLSQWLKASQEKLLTKDDLRS